ncbi:MAG: hypothetical protein ABR915_21850, partial [Thermoguttaceae bacterium]
MSALDFVDSAATVPSPRAAFRLPGGAKAIIAKITRTQTCRFLFGIEIPFSVCAASIQRDRALQSHLLYLRACLESRCDVGLFCGDV